MKISLPNSIGTFFWEKDQGEKIFLHKIDVSEKATKFEKFTNDVKTFFETPQLQN